MSEETNLTTQDSTPSIGRNEPCPCGSGKKYKRCHGVDAAPKLTQPKFDPSQMPAMPPGMENMDPQMMTQAAQMLQRLPRGQLQRLQSIMQRAMAGKDVTQEAEEFQKTLPPDFQQMMTQFAMAAGQGGMLGGADAGAMAPAAGEPAPSGQMTEEEARRIVEAAAKQGKLSEDQAKELLQAEPSQNESSEGEGKGIGKFWKNLTGNKQP
ncbi:MAG: SEC-C metal-binding domain-containing protein [Bdellovibrionia bacterium]